MGLTVVGYKERPDCPKLGPYLLIATCLIVAIRTARWQAEVRRHTSYPELEKEIEYAAYVSSKVLSALVSKKEGMFPSRKKPVPARRRRPAKVKERIIRKFRIQVQKADPQQLEHYMVTLVPAEQDGTGQVFGCPEECALAGLLTDLGFGGDDVAAILEDLLSDSAGVNMPRQVEDEVAEQLGCSTWTPRFEPWNDHHSDSKLTDEQYWETLAKDGAIQIG